MGQKKQRALPIAVGMTDALKARLKDKEHPADSNEMSIETFNPPGRWQIRTQDSPSCFNGIVSVERYRVTVEKIQEPVDVIRARLQELWDTGDNHHHRDPIRQAGRRFGMELSDGFGARRRKP